MRIIGSSILALSLAAASCGDGDGSSGGGDTIGGIEYTSLGEDKYKFAGTADNGGDSSHSYEVAFDLEAGTPVTLNLFTRDDLTDGVKLDFSLHYQTNVYHKNSIHSKLSFLTVPCTVEDPHRLCVSVTKDERLI